MRNVSIIIPTYNREKTIEKSIRSVLAQTYTHFELIIIDDGSSDNTKQVVSAIDDERIVYYKQENAGASAARNKGVTLARYDLIAFHDSDDMWRPEKLEVQMKYLENHPDCDVIYCGFQYHKQNGDSMKAPVFDDVSLLSGRIFDTLIVKNMVGTPTMLMKKACFEDVGGFDTSILCLEDWELSLRLSEKYVFGFVNESLMDTYENEGSVSTRTAVMFETKCKMIVKYKQYLVEKGLFDKVVMDMFNFAQSLGILDQIKKMFMLYLSGQ